MPYVAEAVWPHITFNQGLDITLLEPAGLLFVSERFGKIWRAPADTKGDAEEKTLVVDLNDLFPNLDRLLGLEFHPDFSVNRRVFLYYCTSKMGPCSISMARVTQAGIFNSGRMDCFIFRLAI